MMFTVLFFMCGILEIMGRPNIKSQNASDGANNLAQIPPWPLSKNTFLLPRPLKVDDTINITIVLTGSRKISISFISQNSSSNSTNTICALEMDLEKDEVSIGNETYQDELASLIHEENGTTFINISFKRRAASGRNRNDGYGILFIHGHNFYKRSRVLDKHLDNLRLLQLTGDNFRVSKIGFEFA